MWSYPNYVPLPARDVERIAQRLSGMDFDSIHSAFWAINRSVARHLHGRGESRSRRAFFCCSLAERLWWWLSGGALEAEIEHRGITGEGLLRAAVFKGVREAKAKECAR